ncbi:MAG: peptidoglycan editing factor PgeF [Clostridiales bacterium]|nr:peptidoglycan editing factor PgeF [Clostridiales bacterium]
MSHFKRITADNGVVYFRSELITCPHGFASRIGGVSEKPHTSSLNLAFGRGDDDSIVLENLRLFSDAVGVDAESVVSLHQIHSSSVLYADESMRGEGYFIKTERECDGYVTDQTGITLGVKTADCVPILFHDPTAKLVGAVHAGWRGSFAGIAGVCVDKLISLGAKPENIRAAIGPAIHYCCYEVGDDFIEAAAAFAGREAAERFVTKPSGSKRYHADIIGMNEYILHGRGLVPENIDVCDYCTNDHPELFYSHRYSHGVRGTMLSVIAL